MIDYYSFNLALFFMVDLGISWEENVVKFLLKISLKGE